MSSKSIFIISSYIVSKLTRFLRHSVDIYHILQQQQQLLQAAAATATTNIGLDSPLKTF